MHAYSEIINPCYLNTLARCGSPSATKTQVNTSISINTPRKIQISYNVTGFQSAMNPLLQTTSHAFPSSAVLHTLFYHASCFLPTKKETIPGLQKSIQKFPILPMIKWQW
jgi:hypothetical protein